MRITENTGTEILEAARLIDSLSDRTDRDADRLLRQTIDNLPYGNLWESYLEARAAQPGLPMAAYVSQVEAAI
jgi:hypothetical protein